MSKIRPDRINDYRRTHIFRGDTYLGMFDKDSRSIRLAPEHGEFKQDVETYFIRALHIRAKVFIDGEAESVPVPLPKFPTEIIALMTPQAGDLTVSVVDWARENWSPDDFNRFYRGRVDRLQPETDPGTSKPATAVPPAPAKLPDEEPPVSSLNAIGLPHGAPDDFNSLRKFLKDEGVETQRGAKLPDLVELYKKHTATTPVPEASQADADSTEAPVSLEALEAAADAAGEND